LGQLNNILEISDSEEGLNVEKSGGVIGEEGECGDAEVTQRGQRETKHFLQTRKYIGI